MANYEDTSAFAERVRVLRAALGLSFDAVGAAVGVSGESIRRYEMGVSAPRGRRLVTRLEVALEANPGELWALLTGVDPHSRGDDDSDGPLLDAVMLELRELRAALEELRRQQNDGPLAVRRGDRQEVPVAQAS